QPGGGRVQQASGGALEGVLVPVAVLGEGLQGLPVAGAVQADEGLGDGVLLDVQGQAGEPLPEALEAGVGEGLGEGLQERLPVVEQLGSLQEAPPVFDGVRDVTATDILRTGGASGYPPLPTSDLLCRRARGHIFRKLLFKGPSCLSRAPSSCGPRGGPAPRSCCPRPG